MKALSRIFSIVLILIVHDGFSQCTLNLFSTPDTVLCGECVTLTAFGSMDGNVAFQEDFNSGSPVGWQFTQTTTIANNTCGVPSPDGTDFMWMGDASVNPRDMTTVGFDLTLGGTICFEMRYSIQGDASPCEGPDLPDEGVFLQYSTNNGATWITINYWDPNGGNDPSLTNWNQYCVAIPAGAMTTNTMIQWHQDAVSGAEFDHWGIDNVIITLNDPNSVITWLHDGYSYPMGSSGGDDPTQVCLMNDSTFTAEITNGANTCTQTITVNVKDPTMVVTAAPDTSICPGECVQIIGEASVIISPASTPTFADDEFSLITGGSADMDINVTGLNQTILTSSSITEVCLTGFTFSGTQICTTFGGCTCNGNPISFGATCNLDISSFDVILTTPNGCQITLVPNGVATGTDYTNVCFVPSGGGNINGGGFPAPGIWNPDQPFSNLNGCDANGVWNLEVNAPGGLGFGIGTLFGWSISFDDPEISYPAIYNWSPTTNMTNSNTLNPTVCPPATQTYVLEATDSNNCVTVSDPVTITVAPCVNCVISSLTATPGACVPATNSYTVSGLITFNNAPATGTLTVTDCHGNDTIINAPFTSPQAYSISGITADGVACNVTAVFSADAACTLTTNYTAPTACSVVCSISGLTANPGLCQPATNTYDLLGTITFSNAPATGTLTVTDCHGNDTIINAPFTSPQAYSISGITADGAACNVIAVFSADATCTLTTNYNAPSSCTVTLCNMDSLLVSQTFCVSNTFMVSGDVYFSTPPSTGTLVITINDGTSTYDTIINAPFNSPESWSVSGVPTGGGIYTVDVTFSADAGCTIGLSATAPNNCDCSAYIGTFTNDVDGIGATNNIILCFGETFTTTSNGDFVPPAEALAPDIQTGTGNPASSYSPDIGYFIYSCPPTIALTPSTVFPDDDLNNDPCLIGLVGFGNSFNDINSLGGPSYAGPWVNNTIYYVPVTFYDSGVGYYSYTNTLMPCYSMGPAFAVQYLTEVTYTSVPNCQDSSVTITVMGGLPEADGSLYTASNLLPATANFVNTTATHNGTIVINGLQNGDMYSFDIVDTNGCPVTVTGGPFLGLPNANAGVDDTTCTLTYNLNATTSFGTGIWTGTGVFSNPNSATSSVTVAAAGTYTFTWTEDNTGGCTSADNTIITFNILSIPNTPTNPTCNNGNDGQIILAPQGGVSPYTYLWDAAANNQITNPAINLGAGSFMVTVTDAFGCSQDSTFGLTEPTPFTYTTTSVSSNCGLADGSVTVVGFAGGTGGYTYDWGAGPVASNTLLNLTPGTYTVTVADNATPVGCDTTFTITVGNNPSFTASITGFTDATCNGYNDGTATAGGSDPLVSYNFNWFNASGQATQTATGLAAGTYDVELTDPNTGCVDTATVTIGEPTLVTVTAATPINICLGQSANLTATGANGNGGAYTYNWDAGTFIGSPYVVTPITNTTYSVFAMDVDGCPSAPVNVNVIVSPGLIVTTDPDFSICAGDPATFSAYGSFGNGNSASYVYTWDDGINVIGTGATQTVSPAITTTYTVTLDDGCTTPLATAQITITVNPLPPVVFSVDMPSVCLLPAQAFEFSTDTTGGLFSSILWNFGDGNTGSLDTISHLYASSGVYDVTLTLTDTNGCINSLTNPSYVEVYQNPIADFTMTPNPTSMFDPTIHFYDQSTPPPMAGWAWDIGGLDSSYSQNFTYTFPEDTGHYLILLTVTDIHGCEDTTSNTAIVIGEFGIFVPNAFTPDGDGMNDGFFPNGFGINETDYSFFIFDRWGELLFESHKTFNPWDGTYKGKLVQNGVYVWKLLFTDINGQEHSYVGHVTIIR